jgi:ribonuclease P protein subunit POP4
VRATPDVIRCEFIGTEAQVAKSPHSDYVGISGEVIDETRNTFTILREGKREVVVKDSAVFRFKFHDGTIFEIDGKILVARPEDRLKRRVRRLW